MAHEAAPQAQTTHLTPDPSARLARLLVSRKQLGPNGTMEEIPDPPLISSVSPLELSRMGGTRVTIRGAGFSPLETPPLTDWTKAESFPHLSVMIGGVPCPVVEAGPSSIVCISGPQNSLAASAMLGSPDFASTTGGVWLNASQLPSAQPVGPASNKTAGQTRRANGEARRNARSVFGVDRIVPGPWGIRIEQHNGLRLDSQGRLAMPLAASIPTTFSRALWPLPSTSFGIRNVVAVILYADVDTTFRIFSPDVMFGKPQAGNSTSFPTWPLERKTELELKRGQAVYALLPKVNYFELFRRQSAVDSPEAMVGTDFETKVTLLAQADTSAEVWELRKPSIAGMLAERGAGLHDRNSQGLQVNWFGLNASIRAELSTPGVAVPEQVITSDWVPIGSIPWFAGLLKVKCTASQIDYYDTYLSFDFERESPSTPYCGTRSKRLAGGDSVNFPTRYSGTFGRVCMALRVEENARPELLVSGSRASSRQWSIALTESGANATSAPLAGVWQLSRPSSPSQWRFGCLNTAPIAAKCLGEGELFSTIKLFDGNRTGPDTAVEVDEVYLTKTTRVVVVSVLSPEVRAFHEALRAEAAATGEPMRTFYVPNPDFGYPALYDPADPSSPRSQRALADTANRAPLPPSLWAALPGVPPPVSNSTPLDSMYWSLQNWQCERARSGLRLHFRVSENPSIFHKVFDASGKSSDINFPIAKDTMAETRLSQPSQPVLAGHFRVQFEDEPPVLLPVSATIEELETQLKLALPPALGIASLQASRTTCTDKRWEVTFSSRPWPRLDLTVGQRGHRLLGANAKAFAYQSYAFWLDLTNGSPFLLRAAMPAPTLPELTVNGVGATCHSATWQGCSPLFANAATPVLVAISPPVARLGDTVTIQGLRLGGGALGGCSAHRVALAGYACLPTPNQCNSTHLACRLAPTPPELQPLVAAEQAGGIGVVIAGQGSAVAAWNASLAIRVDVNVTSTARHAAVGSGGGFLVVLSGPGVVPGEVRRLGKAAVQPLWPVATIQVRDTDGLVHNAPASVLDATFDNVTVMVPPAAGLFGAKAGTVDPKKWAGKSVTASMQLHFPGPGAATVSWIGGSTLVPGEEAFVSHPSVRGVAQALTTRTQSTKWPATGIPLGSTSLKAEDLDLARELLQSQADNRDDLPLLPAAGPWRIVDTSSFRLCTSAACSPRVSDVAPRVLSPLGGADLVVQGSGFVQGGCAVSAWLIQLNASRLALPRAQRHRPFQCPVTAVTDTRLECTTPHLPSMGEFVVEVGCPGRSRSLAGPADLSLPGSILHVAGESPAAVEFAGVATDAVVTGLRGPVNRVTGEIVPDGVAVSIAGGALVMLSGRGFDMGATASLVAQARTQLASWPANAGIWSSWQAATVEGSDSEMVNITLPSLTPCILSRQQVAQRLGAALYTDLSSVQAGPPSSMMWAATRLPPAGHVKNVGSLSIAADAIVFPLPAGAVASASQAAVIAGRPGASAAPGSGGIRIQAPCRSPAGSDGESGGPKSSLPVTAGLLVPHSTALNSVNTSVSISVRLDHGAVQLANASGGMDLVLSTDAWGLGTASIRRAQRMGFGIGINRCGRWEARIALWAPEPFRDNSGTDEFARKWPGVPFPGCGASATKYASWARVALGFLVAVGPDATPFEGVWTSVAMVVGAPSDHLEQPALRVFLNGKLVAQSVSAAESRAAALDWALPGWQMASLSPVVDPISAFVPLEFVQGTPADGHALGGALMFGTILDQGCLKNDSARVVGVELGELAVFRRALGADEIAFLFESASARVPVQVRVGLTDGSGAPAWLPCLDRDGCASIWASALTRSTPLALIQAPGQNVTIGESISATVILDNPEMAQHAHLITNGQAGGMPCASLSVFPCPAGPILQAGPECAGLSMKCIVGPGAALGNAALAARHAVLGDLLTWPPHRAELPSDEVQGAIALVVPSLSSVRPSDVSQTGGAVLELRGLSLRGSSLSIRFTMLSGESVAPVELQCTQVPSAGEDVVACVLPPLPRLAMVKSEPRVATIEVFAASPEGRVVAAKLGCDPASSGVCAVHVHDALPFAARIDRVLPLQPAGLLVRGSHIIIEGAGLIGNPEGLANSSDIAAFPRVQVVPLVGGLGASLCNVTSADPAGTSLTCGLPSSDIIGKLALRVLTKTGLATGDETPMPEADGSFGPSAALGYRTLAVHLESQISSASWQGRPVLPLQGGGILAVTGGGFSGGIREEQLLVAGRDCPIISALSNSTGLACSAPAMSQILVSPMSSADRTTGLSIVWANASGTSALASSSMAPPANQSWVFSEPRANHSGWKAAGSRFGKLQLHAQRDPPLNAERGCNVSALVSPSIRLHTALVRDRSDSNWRDVTVQATLGLPSEGQGLAGVALAAHHGAGGDGLFALTWRTGAGTAGCAQLIHVRKSQRTVLGTGPATGLAMGSPAPATLLARISATLFADTVSLSVNGVAALRVRLPLDLPSPSTPTTFPVTAGLVGAGGGAGVWASDVQVTFYPRFLPASESASFEERSAMLPGKGVATLQHRVGLLREGSGAQLRETSLPGATIAWSVAASAVVHAVYSDQAPTQSARIAVAGAGLVPVDSVVADDASIEGAAITVGGQPCTDLRVERPGAARNHAAVSAALLDSSGRGLEVISCEPTRLPAGRYRVRFWPRGEVLEAAFHAEALELAWLEAVLTTPAAIAPTVWRSLGSAVAVVPLAVHAAPTTGLGGPSGGGVVTVTGWGLPTQREASVGAGVAIGLEVCGVPCDPLDPDAPLLLHTRVGTLAEDRTKLLCEMQGTLPMDTAPGQDFAIRVPVDVSAGPTSDGNTETRAGFGYNELTLFPGGKLVLQFDFSAASPVGSGWDDPEGDRIASDLLKEGARVAVARVDGPMAQRKFLRYAPPPLPRGAVIEEAYLEFTSFAAGGSVDDLDVDVRASLLDARSASSVSTLQPQAGNGTSWRPRPSLGAGTLVASPNLAHQLQLAVSSEAWPLSPGARLSPHIDAINVSGSFSPPPLVVVLSSRQGDAGQPSPLPQRKFWSAEAAQQVGGRSAPLLFVRYRLPRSAVARSSWPGSPDSAQQGACLVRATALPKAGANASTNDAQNSPAAARHSRLAALLQVDPDAMLPAHASVMQSLPIGQAAHAACTQMGSEAWARLRAWPALRRSLPPFARLPDHMRPGGLFGKLVPMLRSRVLLTGETEVFFDIELARPGAVADLRLHWLTGTAPEMQWQVLTSLDSSRSSSRALAGFSDAPSHAGIEAFAWMPIPTSVQVVSGLQSSLLQFMDGGVAARRLRIVISSRESQSILSFAAKLDSFSVRGCALRPLSVDSAGQQPTNVSNADGGNRGHPPGVTARGLTTGFAAPSKIEPSITAVSPRNGPLRGGTRLTIEGNSFGAATNGSTVWVGGRVPCDIESWSESVVVCWTQSAWKWAVGKGPRAVYPCNGVSRAECAAALGSTTTDVEALVLFAAGLGASTMQTEAVQVTVPGFGFAIPSSPGAALFRFVNEWTSPSSWMEETTPQDGDSVLLPVGSSVLFNARQQALRALVVQGSLEFVDGMDLSLAAFAIMVDGGSVRAGQADQPLAHNVSITLNGVPTGGVDQPPALKTVMLRSGWLQLHGRRSKQPQTWLAVTAAADSTQIQLLHSVDWLPGADVVVASTSHDGDEAEVRTISSVSESGRTITLSKPLTFVHLGTTAYYSRDGVPAELGAQGLTQVELRAEVALLNRSIVVQGDPLSDEFSEPFGARVLVNASGPHAVVAQLDSIEVRLGGRGGPTKRAALDVVHSGSLRSSFVRQSSLHSCVSWGVALNNVSHFVVSSNVFHDIGYRGVAQDSVFGSSNLIVGNLITKVGPQTQVPSDFASGIWVNNPDQVVSNNSVSGARLGFFFNDQANPTSYYGVRLIQCEQNGPVGTVSGNVAHSNIYGFFLSRSLIPLRTPCNDSSEPLPTRWSGFVSWRNRDTGVRIEQVGPAVIENVSVVENLAGGLTLPRVQIGRMRGVWGQNRLSQVLVVAALAPATTSGLTLPAYDGLSVDHITFSGFGRANAIAILPGSVRGCCHDGDPSRMGFEYRFRNVAWLDEAPTRGQWDERFQAVALDMDGSLVSQAPSRANGSHTGTSTSFSVLPWSELMNEPTMRQRCQPAPQFFSKDRESPMMVCEGTNWRKLVMWAPVTGLTRLAIQGEDRSWHETKMRLLFYSYMGKSIVAALVPAGLSSSFRWGSGYWQSARIFLSGAETGPAIRMQSRTISRWACGLTVSGKTAGPRQRFLGLAGKTGAWTYDWVSNLVDVRIGPAQQQNKTDITIAGESVDLDTRCDLDHWESRNCKKANPQPYPQDWVRWSTLRESGANYVGSNFSIASNSRVILDESAVFDILAVGGALRFAEGSELQHPGQEIVLTAQRIVVLYGGSFAAGSPGRPYAHSAVVKLVGDRRGKPYVTQGLHVYPATLLCLGQLSLVGLPVETQARLATSAPAGSRSILVEGTASGWAAGQQLVLSASSTSPVESESRRILSVRQHTHNVSAVELDLPLAFDHSVERHSISGSVTELASPVVSVLSRSVRVVGGDLTAAEEAAVEAMAKSKYNPWIPPYRQFKSQLLGLTPTAVDRFGCAVVVTRRPSNQCYHADRGALIDNIEVHQGGRTHAGSRADGEFAIDAFNLGLPGPDSWPGTGSVGVSGVTLHALYGGGIRLANGVDLPSPNVSIANCTVFDSSGPALRVGGDAAIVTGNVAVRAAFPGASTTEMRAAVEIVANAPESVTLRGTVASGSDLAGFWVSPAPCIGDSGSQSGAAIRRLWEGNEAHSSQYGVWAAGAVRSSCQVVSGFKVFAAQNVGVMAVTSAAELRIQDMTLLGCRRGASAHVWESSEEQGQALEKQVVVSRCVFSGSADSTQCGTQRAQITEGLLLPTFSSGPPIAMPPRVAAAFGAVSGQTHVVNVTFANFGEACRAGRAVATNPDSVQVTHLTSVQGARWFKVSSAAKLVMHRPRDDRINPASCVLGFCQGLKSVIVQDLDGSFVGGPDEADEAPSRPASGSRFTILADSGFTSPRAWGDKLPARLRIRANGSMVAERDLARRRGVVRNSSECVARPEWGATDGGAPTVCSRPSSEYRMLVIESLDADANVRNIAPVAILGTGPDGVQGEAYRREALGHSGNAPSSAVQLLNSESNTGPPSRFTSLRRRSTFWAPVATPYHYTLAFQGPTPQSLRLRLLHATSEQGIVVALWYDNPQLLQVVVAGVQVPDLNCPLGGNCAGAQRARSAQLPTPSSDPGTNAFFHDERTLHVTVRGREPVEIRTAATVRMTLVRAGSLGDPLKLASRLEHVLGMASGDLRLIATSASGEQVTYGTAARPPPTMRQPEAASRSTLGIAGTAFAELMQLHNRISSMAQSGELENGIGVSIEQLGLDPPLAPPSTPPPLPQSPAEEASFRTFMQSVGGLIQSPEDFARQQAAQMARSKQWASTSQSEAAGATVLGRGELTFASPVLFTSVDDMVIAILRECGTFGAAPVVAQVRAFSASALAVQEAFANSSHAFDPMLYGLTPTPWSAMLARLPPASISFEHGQEAASWQLGRMPENAFWFPLPLVAVTIEAVTGGAVAGHTTNAVLIDLQPNKSAWAVLSVPRNPAFACAPMWSNGMLDVDVERLTSGADASNPATAVLALQSVRTRGDQHAIPFLKDPFTVSFAPGETRVRVRAPIVEPGSQGTLAGPLLIRIAAANISDWQNMDVAKTLMIEACAAPTNGLSLLAYTLTFAGVLMVGGLLGALLGSRNACFPCCSGGRSKNDALQTDTTGIELSPQESGFSHRSPMPSRLLHGPDAPRAAASRGSQPGAAASDCHPAPEAAASTAGAQPLPPWRMDAAGVSL